MFTKLRALVLIPDRSSFTKTLALVRSIKILKIGIFTNFIAQKDQFASMLYKNTKNHSKNLPSKY